ncbi:hypothetical protein ACIBCM_30775 [Streptomyces sp. NPDC051018]|uniref:hypothetical protein n=1 Tax=Streptomyces sp. NPDC051018 TaxID=3365639 RepID=UPI0037879F41
MGLGIEVLILDWGRVASASPHVRSGLLEEAVFGDDQPGGPDEEGWVWPTRADAVWYGRYAFRRTLGSFKPHFWAGERWESVRGHTEPGLRTALDRFAAGLFWDGLPDMPEYAAAGPPSARECPWGLDLLMWCSPDEVAGLRDHWIRAAPDIEGLRDPFTGHAAQPDGWIPDFDSFARFLEDWGEVVTEAHRRGWGIVGLPW